MATCVPSTDLRPFNMMTVLLSQEVLIPWQDAGNCEITLLASRNVSGNVMAISVYPWSMTVIFFLNEVLLIVR